MPFGLAINGVIVQPTYVGLSSAGLYQVNIVVPEGLGQGDVPIQAAVGGMLTQPGVLFTLQSNIPIPCGATGGTVGGGSTGGGGGTGGGSGGSGGGSNAAPPVKPYQPKVRFNRF
jgi:hypothetical protein